MPPAARRAAFLLLRLKTIRPRQRAADLEMNEK
jgi:hypothetical protein